MLKNPNQNMVVHKHSDNALLPDLKVRFNDEEISMMLGEGIIQKSNDEQYEFTELGEKIIQKDI